MWIWYQFIYSEAWKVYHIQPHVCIYVYLYNGSYPPPPPPPVRRSYDGRCNVHLKKINSKMSWNFRYLTLKPKQSYNIEDLISLWVFRTLGFGVKYQNTLWIFRTLDFCNLENLKRSDFMKICVNFVKIIKFSVTWWRPRPKRCESIKLQIY